jgi:undecaprenyl-diphosphatase
MDYLQSIVLGVIQGLGEFLPISSSGHLIVVPWMLGWPEHSLAFDVALHVGTLVAVVAALHADWWRLGLSFARGLRRGQPFAEPDGRLLGLLALATVPGAIAGKLLEQRAETVFRNPGLIAVSMVIMAVVLFIADRQGARGTKEMITISLWTAVFIGCAQAVAIVPGVSRSGATITMALFLGLRRNEAARFSFLLATPITLGAALIKVPVLFAAGMSGPLVAGMVSAAIVGVLSIKLLLALVRNHSYLPFVWYRLGFAAMVGLIMLMRAYPPS